MPSGENRAIVKSDRVHSSKRIYTTVMVYVFSALVAVTADDSRHRSLTAIFDIPTQEGGTRLGVKRGQKAPLHQGASEARPRFFAVTSQTWPRGFIPIYQTRRKDGSMKLSRRLTQGRENFVEPLFFALPPGDEPRVSEISGRWSCEATHHDGSIDFLHWEITLIGHTIVGRFDQDTDYRFAWITEGSFNDPLIRLNAEYLDARYQLTGKLSEGFLEGTWRHLEDDDGGTWRAKPVNSIMSVDPLLDTAPLFVYEDALSHQQAWQVGDPQAKNGSALCRVWVTGTRSRHKTDE